MSFPSTLSMKSGYNFPCVSEPLCWRICNTEQNHEQKLRSWYNIPLFPIILFFIPPLTGSHTESYPIWLKHTESWFFRSTHILIEIDLLFLLHGIKGHVTNTNLIHSVTRITPSDNNIVTFDIIAVWVAPSEPRSWDICIASFHPEITSVKLIGNFPIHSVKSKKLAL